MRVYLFVLALSAAFAAALVPSTASAVCCGATCCLIDAVCRSTGDSDPMNACRECQPGGTGGQRAWSVVEGCFIDGNCVAEGTMNPANMCQSCVGASNATDWTTADGCCIEDGDCNDGDPCTTDSCVSNACENTGECMPDASMDGAPPPEDAMPPEDGAVDADRPFADATPDAARDAAADARNDGRADSSMGDDDDDDDDGCGCSVPGEDREARGLIVIGLAAIAVLLRRKRRA